MPKVSIIVPVYNVEQYLEKCLETLVNQTLEDIEIIIVNDGSKDKSKEIINKYIDNYPNKIAYLEKENGGLSDARNYGIPYSRGEYIAFLDSDDYVELDTYENMYYLAKKEDSDMVECDFIWEYPKKSKVDVGKIYNGKHQMLEKIRVVAWNKLIKRSILEESNVMFPKGYRYEDLEFTYKLLPYINKVSFLKEPCVHYIQRESSISNTQDERTKDIFEILENVIMYYKEKKIYDEFFTELEYTYSRILLCSSFKRMCRIKNKEIRNKLINETWENLNKHFPNWKKNTILKGNHSGKSIYMKSINSFTYKIFAKIYSAF